MAGVVQAPIKCPTQVFCLTHARSFVLVVLGTKLVILPAIMRALDPQKLLANPVKVDAALPAVHARVVVALVVKPVRRE
jgi:hypothetical protein